MSMRIPIIGKRLKEARREKNLTQRDLAEILGMTPQALSKKERLDKTTLENYQIESFEKQTWISRDFLTGRVDNCNERKVENIILTKPLIKEVYLTPISQLANSLNRQQQKVILDIMNYIAESNDYQFDLLRGICEVIFKTSVQKDDMDK